MAEVTNFISSLNSKELRHTVEKGHSSLKHHLSPKSPAQASKAQPATHGYRTQVAMGVT